MFRWMATTWCRLIHPIPMWPIHGRYLCPSCLREYTVYWEAAPVRMRSRL
jgi:hypothetical protein